MTGIREIGCGKSVMDTFNKTDDAQIKRVAIRTMKSFTTEQKKTFSLLATLLDDNQLRDVAVETMLTIPQAERNSGSIRIHF